jgi:hypothetical protein
MCSSHIAYQKDTHHQGFRLSSVCKTLSLPGKNVKNASSNLCVSGYRSLPIAAPPSAHMATAQKGASEFVQQK